MQSLKSETIHPRLAKLKSIRANGKRWSMMNFGCISYYERLQYAETLIDWFTCGLIPKRIPEDLLKP